MLKINLGFLAIYKKKKKTEFWVLGRRGLISNPMNDSWWYQQIGISFF